MARAGFCLADRFFLNRGITRSINMAATTEDTELTQPVTAAIPLVRVIFSGTAPVDASFVLSRRQALELGRAFAAQGAPWCADSRMSRRHARIELTAESTSGRAAPRAVIHDVGSTKGTFVNGRRASRAELADGDVIRLGSTLLVFRYEVARHVDAEVPLLHGETGAIRLLRYRLAQIARGTAPVLVLGEVGAGKEVTARAVHLASGRSGPFLAFNCAALTETLAESELFGYVANSFSGADRHGRRGFFQAAALGTLLLDEVGELSLPMQAKLLRVLSERHVTRIGSRESEPLDVRVVAATNRDLEQRVAQGSFRADLFSRLRGAVLTVPPLRERLEDIIPLFLRGLCAEEDQRAPDLTARLGEALLLYRWPYNVRELLQLAETLRPLLESESDLLLDLPTVMEWHSLGCANSDLADPSARTDLRKSSPALHPINQPCEDRACELDPKSMAGPRLNAETLRRLIDENQGNLSALSRRIGRSRRQILRWMAEHGITRTTLGD